MASDRQVEASQLVAGKGVAAALEHDGSGVENVHDAVDDRLEDGKVRDVVDSLVNREVDTPVDTLLKTHIVDAASPWEKVLELVEGAGKHSI